MCRELPELDTLEWCVFAPREEISFEQGSKNYLILQNGTLSRSPTNVRRVGFVGTGAKITQFEKARIVEKNIFNLHIAMSDAQ